MMSRLSIFLMLALGLIASVSPVLSQESDSAVRERMRERLPHVDALLKQELVGENNRGLLEARGALDASQKGIVDSENRDRNEVYRMIAERTNQSVEDVGKQRALQIRNRAAPGIWLQNPNGEWYRK